MKIIKNLKTDRLTIRPFQEKDLKGFLDFMLDKEATKYLMFSKEQKTKKGAAELFNFVISSYDADTPIHSYVVADKNDNFVGSCGFSEIDKDKKIYECYYSILPSMWRNGYATESMKALIQYCFKTLKVKEVRAYMSPENPMSAGVASKNGMTYAGIQKHPLFQNEGKLYVLTASAQ